MFTEYQHFIAVDWGTSHLRAYLCLAEANKPLTVLEQVNNVGVKKVLTDFQTTLMDSIAPWAKRFGHLPILMIGQIGSSIGWKETQYLHCPISPTDVISAGTQFNCQGHQITIFPGLRCQLHNHLHDSMRGEEFHLLGWLAMAPQHLVGKHLVCLPGTHTKWVLIEDGKVVLFKTALTGELYDLLSSNSVLIQEKVSDLEFDFDAFIQGADFSLSSATDNFAHGLFSVRSKQLFEGFTTKQAHAYLSGILIGCDVRAAKHATEWALSQLSSIAIIGPPHLNQCFAKALNLCNVKTTLWNVTDATLAGFNVVYQQGIPLIHE
ncbi:2-dehydro-3-deoxygalactonokinase [Shewanella inventionis]|uniref:2-dehydro-3-deoxygalactonokinase n=1 Tax=Shewanella inventionis TaxID=1738770 RepID=A0ABQ1JEN5_9GAMM|nr:2-dehydro-3-deoxygalactonokinase [Shewanella inventionis]MCL1158098.1 2-dehydro-3-deoxygalactonokinase [Shewanella inventionis]UAL43657.1 2-dehydro-3-deoxygalactonokinase [Shewanella inventionis]GGB65285.1 2-dehydro-3-deoxygalactonokinase [Shewanella inventionis]